MRLTKFFITVLATLSFSLLGSVALPTTSNNSETVAQADDTEQTVSVEMSLNNQTVFPFDPFPYVQNKTTINDIFGANETASGATKGSLALELQLTSYVANNLWTAKQAGIFLSNFTQNSMTSTEAEQEISFISSYYDSEAGHLMLDKPDFDSMMNAPITPEEQQQAPPIAREIPVKSASLTMKVTYQTNDGTALPADTFKEIGATADDQSRSFSKSITGADKQTYTDTEHMLIPKVPGYTANTSSVTFDKDKVDSSGVQPVTVTYVKNNNIPVTPVPKPTPTPSTPTTFQVYGKKKFYSYQNVNFKKSERIKKYAKKPRVYAPVFTVVRSTQSKAGNPRYQLSDGSYITAKSAYVGKLFLQKKAKTLYVTNPRGTWTHATVMFNYPTQLLHHLKQGTKVTVTHLIKNGPVTRYTLADGTFITGNKRYVTTTKPKKVIHVKARDGRNLYSDVNLTHRLKHYRKGHIFTVKSWDYSHGHNLSVSGTKRYKISGGYITGNPKLVKIVK